MSTASRVRETYELTGDDAWRTLAATGRARLVRDAFKRLRAADGFSHSRSLAFSLSLVCVQGLIALVGLAVDLGQTAFSQTIRDAVAYAVPGPASGLLARTIAQAQRVGFEHRSLPLIIGLCGTLITATTATAQLIRGVNRLYGIEADGPTLRRYGRAFVLAMVIIASLILAVAALTLGHRHLPAEERAAGGVVWRILRWPVALSWAAAGFGAVLRWAPNRRQPQWSWLMFGGAIGVAGWTLVTGAFAVLFRLSSSFGQVYGALAGVVALQLWTFGSSVAIFFGAAVAAQLEAVRSGTQPSR
jgi:uncharacterized BrkB/YihY/UPF0761 family membrane protein